ncbi:hypothetical protein CPB86DRAFT_789892, partial [Serendipita vermifera]
MSQANLALPSEDLNTRRAKRPGSPLRNSITASPQHSEEGSPLPDRYDNNAWGDEHMSPLSPALGATFAKVASSIVSSLRSPPLRPTDEEIEAEAIKERERSRREAERILTMEAEERRLMEEKILALRGGRGNNSQTSLALSSIAADSPRKEDAPGWWQHAKNRMSGTRELTPAQQIIQDTKVKDKESKKNKGKEPKTPTKKMSDPSILHLDIPQGSGGYHAGSNSPGSRSPSHEGPSREATTPTRDNGVSAATRLSKDDNPPTYAKFTPSGTLDIPETLLTIARRFEKLERWTVGHVRALEDRVGDVEKWLVDKEEARQASEDAQRREKAETDRALGEMKAKAEELRRLVDESKRNTQSSNRDSIRQTVESEVQKAVNNIRSSLPTESHRKESDVISRDLSRVQDEVAQIRRGLQEVTSKISEMKSTATPVTPVKNNDTPRSRSPGAVTTHYTGGGSASSRSRLPYPSGDYASGDGYTPPTSPPPGGINGHSPVTSSSNYVPPNTPSLKTSNSYTSLGNTKPPTQTGSSYTSLSIPSKPTERASSTSPTPRNRKRYTVALGGPLTSPLEQLAQDFEEAHKDAPAVTTDDDSPRGVKLIGSTFSRDSRDTPSPNEKTHVRDDTIGGTPIDLARVATLSPQATGMGSLSGSGRNRERIRAQSAYGAPVGWDSISKGLPDTQPLRPRRRSGDLSGEFGAIGKGTKQGSVGTSKQFVDPLVLRKEKKESQAPPRLPAPNKGKTSFGELLAFFDEKKG